MARSYKEKDLSFYTEIENPRIRVDITQKGRVISWSPIKDVEGYAIYKGSNRIMKVSPQRHLKIVVISTHNSILNKGGFYPSRNNVAISEIEVYANGMAGDFTDGLASSSFTASSNFDANTSPYGAFDNASWEGDKKGWQSAKIQENSHRQDHLREWIAIDFGSDIKIDKIRIQNGSDAIGLCGIYEYRIDVSQDGVYWTPLHQGTLDRDSAFQDINLQEAFYENVPAEEDWELIETVGTITTSYVDSEATNKDADYRVTGIVVGDISFETIDANTVDLKLTGEFESVRQDITNRIRSQKGQWRHHPNLGSNFELIEGMKNTRETALYGQGLIEESLLSDGRIHPNDLNVRAVPKSITQVDYYTIVTSGDTDEPIVVVENKNM